MGGCPRPHSGTRCRARYGLLAAACLAPLLAGCRTMTFWSPDGKRLVLESRGGLQLLEPGARACRWLVRGTAGKREPCAPCWSPDGRRLCYFEIAGNEEKGSVALRIADTRGGPSRLLVPRIALRWRAGSTSDDPFADVRSECEAAWSPDGREIVYGLEEEGLRTFRVVPAAGGASRRLLPPGPTAGLMAWSPGGERLAYFAGSTHRPHYASQLETVLRDGSGRRAVWKLPAGTLPFKAPRWSADGRSLFLPLYLEGEERPRTWLWQVDAATGRGRRLVMLRGDSWWVALSGDGGTALYREDNSGWMTLARRPGWRGHALPAPPKVAGSAFSTPTLTRDGGRMAALVLENDWPVRLLVQSTQGGAPREVALAPP